MSFIGTEMVPGDIIRAVLNVKITLSGHIISMNCGFLAKANEPCSHNRSSIVIERS